MSEHIINYKYILRKSIYVLGVGIKCSLKQFLSSSLLLSCCPFNVYVHILIGVYFLKVL